MVVVLLWLLLILHLPMQTSIESVLWRVVQKSLAVYLDDVAKRTYDERCVKSTAELYWRGAVIEKATYRGVSANATCRSVAGIADIVEYDALLELVNYQYLPD